MTNHGIQTVQDYLTIISDNRVKRILDIKKLINRHPVKKVVSLMEELAKQKEEILEELLMEDKTSSTINEIIATIFRLNMAVETIRQIKEVEMA